MRVLVNEKLSEHKFKTPEGYLICTDAILARTGKQSYKRSEVFGLDCKDADSDVEIDRKPEEVFADATLASFENKPLTVEHPDEDVNVNNHKDYAVGFVRDVKRGQTATGEDVILGTLVVTDAKIIEEIENGEHTDLSCGYDCDIEDEANPQQRRIRGNHVALCQQGRAGIARIVDSVKDAGILSKKEVSKLYELAQDYWKKAKNEKDYDTMRKMSAVLKQIGELYTITKDSIDKRVKQIASKNDSTHDVEPREGEDKADFISRFMSETKEEYPDIKQRLAVAYSYWKNKNKDSIKDKLVEIPQLMLNTFEDMLSMKHIKIDRKGKTMFGRIHYQVSSDQDFRSFTRALDEIDAKMEAKGVPMTFNAGSNGTICTAGIDLDQMATRDSVKDEDLHTGQMYKDKTSTVGGVFTIKKRLGNGKVLIEWASNKAQQKMDINDLMSKIRNNKVELIDSIRDEKTHYEIARIKNGKIYLPAVADAWDLSEARYVCNRWNRAYGGGYTIIYADTKKEVPWDLQDSLKKYNVYYKDEDGNNCIKVVKASSLEDAIKKVK